MFTPYLPLPNWSPTWIAISAHSVILRPTVCLYWSYRVWRSLHRWNDPRCCRSTRFRYRFRRWSPEGACRPLGLSWGGWCKDYRWAGSRGRWTRNPALSWRWGCDLGDRSGTFAVGKEDIVDDSWRLVLYLVEILLKQLYVDHRI